MDQMLRTINLRASLLFSALCLMSIICHAQYTTTSASTGGLKYNLLEVAMGKWAGWCPDADQDVREKVIPMYPRTIVAFWHSSGGDPMIVTGDPYVTAMSVAAFPSGTVDRAVISSTLVQNRPFESKVAVRNALTPKFDVGIVCSYNPITNNLNVQVTGTALTALTGEWRINALVTEDSISSGVSSTYNQSNFLNTTGSVSCTGSPSWYIGLGNPITSGSSYSHMYVTRAILCPGANIWGETSFTNPASGTSVTKSYNYTVPSGTLLRRLKVIGMVEKYGSTSSDREVENAIQVNAPVATFYFAGGRTQTKSVCQNSTGNSVDTLMAVYDQSAGESLNWNMLSGPAHGTASVAYTATSVAGVFYPSGLTYTPTAGYVGNDTFRVRASNGTVADTTTIYVTVISGPSAITGTLGICLSATTTLSSSPGGGTWTSGTTSVATIGSASGIANGAAVGTSVITYKLPNGCRTTSVLTVNTTPSAGTITGVSSVCVAATTTLTATVPGGTWSSSSTAVATIGSGTGIATGVAVGTTIITYSVTNPCGTATTTYTLSVDLAPTAGTITGPASVCAAATTTLTATVPGGTWSSASPAIATVGASDGVVSGVTAGSAIISYSVSNTCGTATITYSIAVLPLPDAGTISGLGYVCETMTITLTDPIGGGTWSSSNSNATVSSTGVVTGVTAGTATISYTVANDCGPSSATMPVVVIPIALCGVGLTTPDNGKVTVFPNPTSGTVMINTTASGTFAIYTIDGRMIDSYEIKAPATSVKLSGDLANGLYMCKLTGNDGSITMIKLEYKR